MTVNVVCGFGVSFLRLSAGKGQLVVAREDCPIALIIDRRK